MDVPIDHSARRSRRRLRTLCIASIAVAIVIAAAAIFSSRTAPRVRGNNVEVVVRSGTFRYSIPGVGEFRPRQTHTVVAQTKSQVKQINALPGTRTEQGDTLMLLIDPASEKQLAESRLRLQTAQSDRAALEFQVRTQLDRQSETVLDVEADLQIAQQELEAKQALSIEHVISKFELARSRVAAEKLTRKLALERKSLGEMQLIFQVQAALSSKGVDVARQNLEDAEAAVRALTVTATVPGEVQEILVSPGEFVTEGQKLATIADPHTLEATLRVSENSAEGILPGAHALLNVNGRQMTATVVNVNPKVTDGLVSIDLDFDPIAGFIPRTNEALTGEITAVGHPGKLFVNRIPEVTPNAARDVDLVRSDGTTRRVLIHFGAGTQETVEVTGANIAAGDTLVLGAPEASEAQHKDPT